MKELIVVLKITFSTEGRYAARTSCPICESPRLKGGKPQRQFIYLGVKNQLLALFRRPDWAGISKLKPVQNSDILSDVSTGKAWKRLLEFSGGILARYLFDVTIFTR